MKLKYFLKKFEWMKVYFSPFKIPKPKLYIGKIAIGTPYFFPRKWVKYSNKDAIEAATKDMNNPKLNHKSFQERYEKYKKNYTKPIPRKIGFDFVGLGYKTKWSNTDYRFEWGPIWSFVFFKWQIAITFIVPKLDHYWECWLYYHNHTNKNESVKNRLAQAKKEFPCEWTTTFNKETKKICYWDYIIKNNK